MHIINALRSDYHIGCADGGAVEGGVVEGGAVINLGNARSTWYDENCLANAGILTAHYQG